MKTTNSFWSILSLTAAMFFFVSCSNNDDSPAKVARHGANQIMTTYVPHGVLRIINNTNHIFENDLFAYNKSNSTTYHDYGLYRGIIINSNSDVTINNYNDTYVLGLNNSADDYWHIYDYTFSHILPDDKGYNMSGYDAQLINYMTNGLSGYVQWIGMDFTDSYDNLVTLKFKIDYSTGDIDVNEPQHHDDGNGGSTFTTTGEVDSQGNTTITIEDI